MHILDKIKNDIAKILNKALEIDSIQASDLVYPPNPNMGDLSFPCFKAIKKFKKSPDKIAELIINKVPAGGILAKTKLIGFYLNFELDKLLFSRKVINEIKKRNDKYGFNNIGKGKKVMVEYSNANTHKEYHVGHLRNLCYGDSVTRILNANGYNVIPVSYINDFGIHVAKTLWNYDLFIKKKYKGNINDISNPERGVILGEIYADSVARVEKDKLANQMISGFMKKIETRKGDEYELWKKTRQWSIDHFDKIYDELEIKFKKIFYESEFIKKGLKMIDDLIDRGILEKSQGAVIANLEKYNLGVLLFLRSDGTALYPVADLPLAEEKFIKYKLYKSIYVVDIRQSLYFKQLFKVLEMLGYKKEMAHLCYEFVKLPSGMMSSRSGNTITYNELRDKIFKKIKQETKKRHKDWGDNKVNNVVNIISKGAMKFEMIKIGSEQVINFDINKALEFSGFTSAYLQYTYARISSIIKKAEFNIKNVKLENLKEEKEYNIILKMAKYPEIIKRVGDKYDPSELAKYLFELAQIFNDYYHNIPVLKAGNDIKNARLDLINSIRIVLKNGLDLLGIEVLQEM